MRLLAASLFLAAAAYGADLTGIWIGQLPARFGEVQDVAFRFTQKGTELSGKQYGETDSLPVIEGKIEGDQVSFLISNEMNGGQTKFSFNGVIKGDTIELTRLRILRPEQVNDPAVQKTNLKQTFTLKRLL